LNGLRGSGRSVNRKVYATGAGVLGSLIVLTAPGCGGWALLRRHRRLPRAG
jgi:hypothetical protein